MIEALVWGAVAGILTMVVTGIRRQPWQYCVVVGLGFGLVLGTLRLSTLDETPGLLVLLGALGGSISTLGFERGERARDRRSAAIIGSQSSTVA